MVFFVVQQSFALGLGDIQVNSYLGEPLKAQVDLIELSKEYEASLKVGLADPEEYKKNGFAYPYGIKYKFNVINEDGKHPMVRISSAQVIEDPFLNLLLEVTSSTGKIIKIFTFLIDPSPDLIRSQEAMHPVALPQASQPEIVKVTEPQPAVVVSPVIDTPPSQPNPTAVGAVVAHAPKNKHIPNQRRYARNPNTRSLLSSKLSLTLSTSLTISSTNPDLPLNSKENNDVLQEELIAKEKTLSDLNGQIAEMKTIITGLQTKLNLRAESGVNASGVLALSGIDVIPVMSQAMSAPVASVKVITPLAEANPLSNLVDGFNNRSQKLLLALSVILLGLLGFYWQRKRKSRNGSIPTGLFDDLNHPQADDANITPANVTKQDGDQQAPISGAAVLTKTLPIGEQSMKIPAYKEQKPTSNLPPEYDLLEEADIYLRFGHDKLAEEVLRDALKINSANPEIHLKLLGIFETRGDAKGYAAAALEMKAIADTETWKKVAEMGKRLDIGNPLYD